MFRLLCLARLGSYITSQNFGSVPAFKEFRNQEIDRYQTEIEEPEIEEPFV